LEKCVKEQINKKTRIVLEAAIMEVQDCMNPKTRRITLSEMILKLILAIHKLDV